MLPCDRSHQLGRGQMIHAAMPRKYRPSRSVLGSQSRYAAMPCNQLLPPVLGSLCYHAAMPIYDCSHQLGEGQRSGAEMPSNIRPPQLVRERPQIRHRNDTVCTPFPISFMEVNNSQQRCHPDTTSRGKGQQSFAEMPNIEHPSQPVHRGHQNNAAMPFLSRLVREGSTKACNQQCQSFTTLPTSLWANPGTQKCHEVDAHQLGKDITFTLIKPPLFLPFLLIYGRNTSRSQQCQMRPFLPPDLGHQQAAEMPLLLRPI